MSYGDVWRDEDDYSYDTARDELFYGRHPYDPRLPLPEGGGGFSFADVPACPRCRYLHQPEEGCECKSAGCLGRTDSDGFCSRCGFTRPIGRAA